MNDVFVAQLMSTPVLTIEPETAISDAGHAIVEEGIKSVVVVDDDCTPEGILTSTDFVRAAADERAPTAATVGEYMTTDIVTTTPDAQLGNVASEMRQHDISHVPVVDADEQVSGILTATDLTQYLSGMADLAAKP